MKTSLILLLLIFTTACGGQTVGNQSRAANSQSGIPNQQAKQAVLVELFTSEG